MGRFCKFWDLLIFQVRYLVFTTLSNFKIDEVFYERPFMDQTTQQSLQYGFDS